MKAAPAKPIHAKTKASTQIKHAPSKQKKSTRHHR
jgi:hypothetical protein